MSGLAAARADLTAALDGAGYPYADHVPARITPPVVLLVPDDPYIEPGETFDPDELTCRMQVHLVAATASNAKATTDLDTMIDRVGAHLGVWLLDRVSAPYVAAVDDREFLAARISISTLYNRKDTTP